MTATTAVPQIGCRTRCQHPVCGRAIEFKASTFPGGKPFWAHLDGWGGEWHLPTPVEPEYPGEQLVARVQASVRLYQRCRAETLVDFAAYLRGRAGSGVDETAVALRWAAREAERRAGGES